MTGAALIDQVLSYTDNVSSSDAGNTGRRARILSYLQQTLQYVWNYRSWRFMYKTGSVTINSSGVGILPSDFGQFGWKGALLNTNSTPMEEDIDALNIYSRFAKGERDDSVFTIFDYDSTTSKPKVQTLQASVTLTAFYCRHCPTAADSSAVLPIPLDYHETVLLPGTIVKSRMSKGDVRDFQSDFLSGLELMCRKEAPMQGTPQQLPMSRLGW